MRSTSSTRRLGVDRERHQRLAALLRPRDGHVRDVHARLAEHRPDAADHAGHVVVAEEDHPRRELEVDREAERAGEEEARLRPDRRAGDLDVVDGDRDEVRVVARRPGALLGHLDPPLRRDHGRVDVVDRLVDAALEGAVQRRDRQQARVVLGDPAVERERDPARVAAGELDREPAELRRERDVRAEHLEVLGADDRDVDGVRDEAALERRDDLLRDDQARAVLRLLGRGGEVRRRDDVLEPEQLALVRLGREDVERRAGDLAGADRRPPAPARRRARPRAALTIRTPSRIFAIAPASTNPRVSSVSGRCSVRKSAAAKTSSGGLDVLGAELAEALRRDERVVADDAHAEPERAPGDLAADPAEAEHAERLVGELDPAPARALPPALLQRRVRLRDVAGERDEQPDRVLGGRDDGRVGRVRDDDSRAASRRRRRRCRPRRRRARSPSAARPARSPSAVSFVAERITIAS